MKRGMLGIVFVLVGIFVFGFVSAESSTRADFIIKGCSYEGEGLSIGECSSDGMAYCGSDANLLMTGDSNEPGLGCARGESDYDWGNSDDYCCPSGFMCGGEDGEFVCEVRLFSCIDFMGDKEGCTANDVRCIWIDGPDVCVEDPRKEYGCEIYDDKPKCDLDKWNLGSKGVGSDKCGMEMRCGGEVYSIPKSKCKCIWDEDKKECNIDVSVFKSHSTGVPDGFSCSIVYDTSAECGEDGKKIIKWDGVPKVIDGFLGDPSTIPGECLDLIDCNENGERPIHCGGFRIKLPGFGLFSLVASLIVIGLYYFHRGKFKWVGVI